MREWFVCVCSRTGVRLLWVRYRDRRLEKWRACSSGPEKPSVGHMRGIGHESYQTFDEGCRAALCQRFSIVAATRSYQERWSRY